MKDRQTLSAGARPSVPFVSPFLHWLAMPAIVFLRSGFGFSFLRSKLVFLSFAWACILYLIYSRLEPGAWKRNWALASFGGGAALLYIVHLFWAFTSEAMKIARHDFHSGTSHLLRIPGLAEYLENGRLGIAVQMWVEPVLVLVAAIILSVVMGEHRLSLWLPWVAAGMWLKEFINYWYEVRWEKKQGDIMEDAEERMPGAGASTVPLPQAAGRKPRTKRPPQAAAGISGNPARELRFAEVLRLMPPFDLQQAERNYRELMKAYHPDKAEEGGPYPGKAAELNEAIEFFRNR